MFFFYFSIAVEPLYPQVCQRIPAYLPTPYSPSPIELSRALNSLASPLSVRREDQPSSSLYQLITLARHHVLTVWCSVQYWVCCTVALTAVQLLAMVLQLPPLLTVGQVMWMCAFVVPVLSAGLLGVPVDRAVMKMPLGKRQCGVDGEVSHSKLVYIIIIIIYLLYCLYYYRHSHLFCGAMGQSFCHALLQRCWCTQAHWHHSVQTYVPYLIVHAAYTTSPVRDQRPGLAGLITHTVF